MYCSGMASVMAVEGFVDIIVTVPANMFLSAVEYKRTRVIVPGLAY